MDPLIKEKLGNRGLKTLTYAHRIYGLVLVDQRLDHPYVLIWMIRLQKAIVIESNSGEPCFIQIRCLLKSEIRSIQTQQE